MGDMVNDDKGHDPNSKIKIESGGCLITTVNAVLTAGGDIILDGAINMEKLSVR